MLAKLPTPKNGRKAARREHAAIELGQMRRIRLALGTMLDIPGATPASVVLGLIRHNAGLAQQVGALIEENKRLKGEAAEVEPEQETKPEEEPAQLKEVIHELDTGNSI